MEPPDATTTNGAVAGDRVDIVFAPLVGPLHLAFPSYNAVSVLDLVRATGPGAIATTALEPGALADPLWRDTPELPLPHTVVPWAEASGMRLETIGVPSPGT
jgi:hypothetical protein